MSNGGTVNEEPKLFSKPEPTETETDSDDSTPPWQAALIGMVFLAFAVGAWIKWDSVALPKESLAGGRNASMRKLLGRIGQLPVTVILAAIGLFALLAALSEIRQARRAATTNSTVKG
jgi:hypothetical protein